MARRGTSKLLILIGIPVIAFGLAKASMYFYVKKQLDEFIQEAASKAHITYESLETHLTGEIAVGDIKVKFVGESEPVSIWKVDIQGPDVLAYTLNHLPILGDPDGPPEHLRVRVHDLAIDLGGDLIQALALEQDPDQAAKTCGLGGTISPDLLKEMGHERLNADMDMSYRYIADRQEFRWDMEVDLKKMQKIRLGGIFSNVSAQAIASRSMQFPMLKKLSLNLNISPRFGREVSAYCAEKQGIPVEEYQEMAANDFIYQIAKNGVRLGGGLKFATRSYFTNWGEIDLEARPPAPLNILSLLGMPAQKMEKTLGLQLAVNNRLITDLSFRLQKDASLFSRKKNKQAKKPLVPKVRYKIQYVKVPPGNLGQHVDKFVRLQLKNGTTQTGALIAIKGGQAEVEQRMNGGKFTAFISVGNIRAAEVKQRLRIDPPSAAKKSEPEEAAPQQAEAAAQEG